MKWMETTRTRLSTSSSWSLRKKRSWRGDYADATVDATVDELELVRRAVADATVGGPSRMAECSRREEEDGRRRRRGALDAVAVPSA